MKAYYRVVVPASLLIVIGLLASIYAVDHDFYFTILLHWMRFPFSRPFMDWEAMPAAIECWAHGVDVYAALPCYRPNIDPNIHVVHNYSPLWLRFTFLATDPVSVACQGLLIVIGFVLALGVLPPPKRKRDLVILLLAAFSSATAYALERANVDVIVFILAVIAVRFWSGSFAWRVLGYALMMLTGLLKFYPLTLLLLFLRERVGTFLILCAVSGLALCAFVSGFGDELRKALAHIPYGGVFIDRVGSGNLPTGTGKLAVSGLEALGIHSLFIINGLKTLIPPALTVLLPLATLGLAAWLYFRAGAREAAMRLPPESRQFLIAGTVLMGGCFFAGQNIGYRAILLILVLPGLSALSSEMPTRVGRAVVTLSYVAVPFVLWRIGLQGLMTDLSPGARTASNETAIGIVHWLLEESLWWWIMGVLGSTMIGFIVTSDLFRVLHETLMMSRPAGHASGVHAAAGEGD